MADFFHIKTKIVFLQNLKEPKTMSDLEMQARIMHQSNQVREELRVLSDWEKEMKQKEAQRKKSNQKQVT